MDVIDAARGHVGRRGEAKGEVGSPSVVVDGLGQRDHVQALLREAVGRLGRAVSAQNKEAVKLEVLIGALHGGHLHGAIGLGDVEQLEGRAAGAEHGATLREETREVAGRHLDVAVVNKALVAVEKSVNLNVLLGVVHDGLDDCAHGGV